MPRFVVSQALLFCLVAAWAALLPVSWWMCHQTCESCSNASNPSGKNLRYLVGRPSAPWAASLVDAVEGGVRDALGSADAADVALSGGLPDGLAAEVRALVAAKLRSGGASGSGGREAQDKNGKGSLLENCPSGRGPVAMQPLAELSLPVLDGMGGRVNPAGLTAPNMSANIWGVPMPNITVEVSPGKILTMDEVVYGYDLAFEAMHLFSYVSWGRVPMQQDPTDALLIADLISRLQPDCFVELGTNTGGGAIFYAEVMKQYQPKPLVVTLDVHAPTINWDKFGTKVCPHCVPVTCHPAWYEKGLIEFVQGFSQEDDVVSKVEHHLEARKCKRTVVMHDSDHRGFAVERDLQIYHRFVNLGSYLIVQDTKLSRMRGGRYQTLEAVRNFLATPAGKKFTIDKTFEYLLFSHHHSGFMQRIAA